MEKKDISLLLYNGTIYSMENEVYNWVAVKDGKIYKTGCNNEYKSLLKLSKKSIDLKGRIVLPGFYDCHVHLVQTGINILFGVDLSEASTIDEVLELIKNKADTLKEGELVQGVRFNISNIKENRYPTRKELDNIAPNNPVWINSIEYHTSVINSMALLQLNLPYDIEGMPRDERNLPLGILSGKAGAFVKNRISQKIDDKMREKAVEKALYTASCNGVTTIHAMEGGYSFNNRDAEFILKNKDKFEQDILLFFQTIDITKAYTNDLKRLGGDIFIDGSFASKTAAISKPYKREKNNFGKLYYNQHELNAFAEEAVKNDIQIAFHAIGDRAIEQALNAIELAQKKKNRRSFRNRIEHFELATDAQIKKAKKLNIILSMQPIFETIFGQKDGLYEKRLIKSYSDNSNRFKKIIDEGILIIGGSDSDVCAINPILGIYSAVNHPKEKSSVSVLEAVNMFTVNAAYASFEENEKGSIKNGKRADMVIIDKNIFQMDKKNIKDAKVEMTIKDGNIIYENF
ncbi:amidohydrolase [Fusobacterium ulcerans]|jgi:predicted amidohydrolase YtcJ|uniref:amidohydrolase n=1 Tax=Fusobacterium ulcerans TaxID=861 RepID=UPI000E46DA25|nr:amidohydrolase [Fusobacterium ulcerans]RGY66004.1 amidohydrolase [Fusobacterium ulcerans]